MTSSLGYASRLAARDDLGGVLGAAEIFDDAAATAYKARKLAELIAASQHLVAFTGAGISTSTGIPDFRGPNGVWTKQRRGEAPPKASIAFEHARPSLTHQALLALQRTGKLKYLVSQNIDSLHLRSGFPRELLAELHGNTFAEKCEACGVEYVRDFDVGSVGFKRTGRKCDKEGCRGAPLRDQCLDWDDALPEDELTLAEKHAARADLALCLGTSMVIRPACDIPMRVFRKQKHKPEGGQLAIVNLQPTQKDKRASLVAHAKCDDVFHAVMRELKIPIPNYTRTDAVIVSHTVSHNFSAASARGTGQGSSMLLTLSLRSAHGAGCPLPWLAAATVRFAHTPDAPAHTLSAPAWAVDIQIDAAWLAAAAVATAQLELTLASGTNAPPATIEYDFEPEPRRRVGRQEAGRKFEVVTCVVDYTNGPPAPGAGCNVDATAHAEGLEPCSVAGQASASTGSCSSEPMPPPSPSQQGAAPARAPPPAPPAGPPPQQPPAAQQVAVPASSAAARSSQQSPSTQEQAPQTPSMHGCEPSGVPLVPTAQLAGEKRQREPG